MRGQDFDSMVGFFDKMVQTKWLSSIHGKIVTLAPSVSQGKVLDVGCGTGKLLQKLMSKFEKGKGVDLSFEMVREARRQAKEIGLEDRLSFEQGDAYELPFEDEAFDASLSTCVMFLLPEPVKGMAEMVRVTKKKGQIMMLNPSPQMNPEAATQYIKKNNMEAFEAETLLSWSNVSTNRHRYSKEQLQEKLESAHLGDIHFVDVLGGLAHITYATK